MWICQKIKKYLLDNYKAVLAILFILVLSIILSVFQLVFLACLSTYRISMFLTIIVDIILFLTIIKIGFGVYKNNDYFNRVLSIAFGLIAYLSLLFQFGIIFFTYYVLNDSSNIIPDQALTSTFTKHTSATSAMLSIVKVILNYVFPNFFKYPSSPGIVVVLQFFLGKFTDLFILAYIVEKLKNKKV